MNRLRAWLAAAIEGSQVTLAFRNVFRQRGRTALTLAVIAVGVAGLLASGGFVADTLVKLRESTIHAQLGHLQVYRAGYHEPGRRSPFKYLIDKPGDVVRTVADVPGVKSVLSRLNFAGVLNNGRTDFAIVGEGVEPSKEAALGTQIEMIDGRALKDADRFGVAIGEGVASNAGVKVGDRVQLLVNTEEGALNNLEFRIVGVFRTASKDYDARAIRVALPDANELMASQAVNAIVVELADTLKTDAVAATLKATLDGRTYEVKTWLELADFYEKTVVLFERQFAFLQAIILLSVLLSVANSVNMTIFERTGEFGTLMALGTRRWPIFRLVFAENVILGLCGSAAGVVLGVALAWLVNRIQIQMPPPPNSNGGYIAGITLSLRLAAGVFVIGLLAAPVASLWPARRISRVPVVDALRMN